MQALSAASRCSCGLANRFVPPSSQGSSMSIEKRRGTRSPPISKPSTCARLRVWPCQVVVTRQLVLACAAPCLALSMRANKSSRLMPLTMVGSAVFAWAVMMDFLFPVMEEHVLEQLGEVGVWIDALAIVELTEQLDIECQR